MQNVSTLELFLFRPLNCIIKSDMYIKLKYIQISLDTYQHITYTQNQKKRNKITSEV